MDCMLRMIGAYMAAMAKATNGQMVGDSQCIQLYGFWSSLEKAVFQKLLTISGVGPRIALALLSKPPEELLRARLERGWKPTPSRMKDGERVLGHAACAFDTRRDALR